MANAITMQQLQEASQDAETLEQLVNGAPNTTVTTRLGRVVPTVATVGSKLTTDGIMQDNKTQRQINAELVTTVNSVSGGYFTSTATLAELQAKTGMAANQVAKVMNDPTAANNGDYRYTGSAWVKGYDALTDAKAYSDLYKIDKSAVRYGYTKGNMIGSKSATKINYGIDSLWALGNHTIYDSIVIPVAQGDLLYLFNSSNTIGSGAYYAFFADDPYVNSNQTRIVPSVTSKTDSMTAIRYDEVLVPSGANYLILNTRFTPSGKSPIFYNWAVHKGAFSTSYTAGDEYIFGLNGNTFNFPIKNVSEYQRKVSQKNLYTGSVIPKTKINNTGLYGSSYWDDVVSPFIPVEYGKTYTISGLTNSKVGEPARIIGVENAVNPTTGFIKVLAIKSSDNFTVTIDDARIKYIAFPLTKIGFGTLAEAELMPVQVEVGLEATDYQPYEYTRNEQRILNTINKNKPEIKVLSNFIDTNKVRSSDTSVSASISKDIGPFGVNYSLKGDTSKSHAVNTLYTSTQINKTKLADIYIAVQKYANGAKAIGALKQTPFTIPSGSLDNPNSFGDAALYPKQIYAHPSIDYSSTAVAGFKYWMIASTFPPSGEGSVLWEDEDLFVSNDAKNWQRVRSVYETDKSYTTTALRLPPHSLVATSARKNAFLPIPDFGSTFEMTVPANNGGNALNKQQVTIDMSGSWKHDPYLLIDNGYVYTYHSFNIRASAIGSDVSRFFVCIRTNDGINWDVVRANGSTMLLTEETSRLLFTTDANGVANYLNFAYGGSRGNPEIVKYGDGDYELFYGYNFTYKYKGTTPYNFDFNNQILIQDVGSGNHPTLQLYNNKLYLLTNVGVFVSSNRGLNWTELPYYPMWLGGFYGTSYKKSCCIGDSGKFILFDTQQISSPTFNRTSSYVSSIYQTYQYEYTNFDDFLSKANNQLVDAYVDVQIVKVNFDKKERTTIYIPCVSSSRDNMSGGQALDMINIGTISLKPNDTLYVYITLNSRGGAEIAFGGIYLS